MLSGALANGFYTFGGITLTLATPWGRLAGRWRWLPALAWAAWAAGLALSLSSLAGYAPGLLLSGAALIICFCPFAFLMGRAAEQLSPG